MPGVRYRLPPQWELSLRPDLYLGRYPQGPHAELAREVLRWDLFRYTEVLSEYVAPCCIALEVLIEQLGRWIWEEPDEPAPTNTVVKEWFDQVLPSPHSLQAMAAGLRQRREVEVRLRRHLTRRFGAFIVSHGVLGAPQQFSERPSYWKHKRSPRYYVSPTRRGITLETHYLARAAIAPLEAAADREMRAILHSLLSRIPSSALRMLVARKALELGEARVVMGRYSGVDPVASYTGELLGRKGIEHQ